MQQRSIKILAIDDDRDNLVGLTALLKEAFPDAYTITALDGKKGIKLASTEAPDVILLDINMPLMNGFEVCKKLKSDKKLSDIPVVFITVNDADKDAHVRALEVGAEGFISRPLDLCELTALIRAMVKIKNANVNKTIEKEQLAKLVKNQSKELYEKHNATLKLLENLHNEDEARKKTESELSKSEEKYRMIVEKSRDIIYILNTAGELTFVSQSVHNLLGYSADELTGKSISTLIHPDDLPAVLETFSRNVKSEFYTPGTEYRIRHSSGEWRWHITRGNSLRDADGNFHNFMGIANDITERKNMEEALKLSEEKFRKAFLTSPDAVSLSRMNDGMLLSVNDGFIYLSGYSEEELLQKSSLELKIWFDPDDRSNVVDKLKKDGIVKDFEAQFRRKNGNVFYGLMSASIIEIKGISCILNTVRDITDRKLAEEETQLNFDRMKALVDILQHQSDSIKEYLDYALSRALVLSKSKIGFISHYSEEKKDFVLNSWSREAMNECTITEKQTVYQLEKTGVWGEVVRQRKPIIINDFQSHHPLKKGYPEGHVNINKFLALPVFSNGSIVSVVSVANKETDYTDTDLMQLTLFTDIVWKVVERRQAEDKTRDIGLQWQRTFDASNDLFMLLDIDFKIIRANHSTAKFLNMPLDCIIGRYCYDLMHCTGNPVHNCPGKRLIKSGKHEEGEYYFEENKSWGSVLLDPLHDIRMQLTGFIHIVRDITERKKMEEALMLSEKRFRDIANNLQEWIWETDVRGKYTYVSPMVEKILGYTPEEVLQKHFYDFFYPEEKEALKQAAFTAFNTKQAFRDFLNRNVHKNGKIIWLSTSGFPMLDDKGKLLGYRGADTDITGRKNNEEELLSAKVKAEESDRLKSAFLANMSHEIRTPLNAIVGFSSLFSNPDLSLEKRKYFSEIIKSRSDDLLNIIDDILEISRIESGNAIINKEQIVLNDVLGDLEIDFRQKLNKIQKSGIQLVCEKTVSDEKSLIITDRCIVKRVFSNLIDNAVKFTESGTIIFGYHIQDNQVLTCYVSDTGIGISAENHDLIFGHFRQADNINIKRLFGGTGLGLSICRGSLALLGGEIWVESIPGEGSTFYFTVPFNYATEPDLSILRRPEEIIEEIDYDWSGKKFLLVEDIKTNLEFLVLILNPTRAELVCAENGSDLRSFYSSLDTFNLVLLDIRLPDADGWDLVKEIKAIRPGLPVIAQTAFAMISDKQKSIMAGCDNYIPKPIRKEILFKMISNLIDN